MADLNTVNQDAKNNAWIQRNSIYQAVNDVLKCHWDPLGQFHSGLRQNSYDGCVSMVYNAALKSDCKEQLIKYLNTHA
jgi:GH24 family phage-related lysozyme (muramidase)